MRCPRGRRKWRYHLPELSHYGGYDVRDWGLRANSEDFMAFVKENGTSPSVAMAMLVGEAVAAVHPERDAPVQAQMPISTRRMIGCDETFKNCSLRITLPVSGTPLDAFRSPSARRSCAAS